MGPVDGVASQLQARLASFAAEHRQPGAAAGIVHGDELAWTGGAGFADVTTRQPPAPGTLYRIGSVTKTFTGAAVMRLHQAGQLHLDDPAVTYLPELRQAASRFGPIETVTIRRMLSHESGLASEPPGTDWSRRAYEGVPARTLEHAAEIAVKVPPGSQQKYSNLAYQLLGEIVTRVSGTPYPRYVQEAILRPLGMSATGFEPLPGALLARRATGYAHRPFSDELRQAPAAPPIWAEGGLWSCVEDLARWLCFQLRAYTDQPQDSPVLGAAQVREMHKARYLGDEEWTQAAGISWFTVRRSDVAWIQHGGGVHGFTSGVCFDAKTRVGAIVLVNGASEAVILARELASIARKAARVTAPVVEPPAAVPEAYRPLLGAYAYAGLGLLVRVEWRNGNLALTNPDGTDGPTLAPAGDPDVFVASPGFRQSGESVAFRRAADGRVISVFLAGVTLPRLTPAG